MNKTKLMRKLLKTLLVILAVWFFLGFLGVMSIPKTDQNLESIEFNYIMWILISLEIYVVGEIFLLYCKKDLFGDPIRTFGKFLETNLLLLMISFIFGFMAFTGIYFVKNILRLANTAIKGLQNLISGFATFLVDNMWLIVFLGIVFVVVSIKYLIYERFIKPK